MKSFVALRLVLLLVILVLILRLFNLQLVDTDTRRYGSDSAATATRALYVPPLRGEIYASDGKTVLAQSVSTYSLAVRPGELPSASSPRRKEVLAHLSQIAGLTSTLTIEPILALDTNPQLRSDLQKLIGEEAVAKSDTIIATEPYTFTITQPTRTLDALKLSRVYSDVVTFNDPISPLIATSNARYYQSVTIKSNIPQEMALAIRENSSSLPGVTVLEDYRRSYPLSSQIQSLSHILGYIGRINECELVSENPGRSWITSMLDITASAPTCRRLVPKTIDPNVAGIGIPPYQSNDRIGKDGLEASYEYILRGSTGIQTLLVDAAERPVGPIITQRPVVDGNNLVLTLDIEFQAKTEEILRKWIEISDRRRMELSKDPAQAWKAEYKPITNGVAIAIDPNTGRILSMVSLPTYDNNVWVDASRSKELQALLTPSEEIAATAPLLNRSIAGTYPPGSTLKQFVGSIALQEGVIAPDTLVRDPSRLLVRDEYTGAILTFPNSSPVDNKLINVSDALKVSSNVFFATVAGGNKLNITNLKEEDPKFDGLGITRLASGLEWFGFGQRTGISLAGEAIGRVPTERWKLQAQRAPWTVGDTYNMAIGQGNMEVTPLQLVMAAAAVANGGTLYKPQLVQSIIDSSGNPVQTFQPEVSSIVPVKPEFLQVIREGMRRSVTEGINYAARDVCSGLAIAGKTGTAEFGPDYTKPDGTITRQSHSWFTGFAPYDNPQIQVVVLLEGTGDLNDGSATLAVPAATELMQAYLNITPPTDRPRECPNLNE
jgi:penicillin-binding protein 2